MRRQADQRRGPGRLARLGDRHVLLTHVDAVRPAGRHQVGPVVEDEQRPVLSGSPAEGIGQRDQLFGTTGRLLAQLHDVGAATQGPVQQRSRIAAPREALADEVEPRRLQHAQPPVAVGGHRLQYPAATGVP